MDGPVPAAKALLLVAVDVPGFGIAGLPRRFDEHAVEGVLQRSVAGVERPVAAPIKVAALGAGLGSLEVGQHVAVGPAAGALLLPAVEIQRVAADVNQAVDRG